MDFLDYRIRVHRENIIEELIPAPLRLNYSKTPRYALMYLFPMLAIAPGWSNAYVVSFNLPTPGAFK